MKRIPAVIRTETIVVKPEQIIFERGDIAIWHDNSYQLHAVRINHQGTWSTGYKDLCGQRVVVLLTDLKVPAIDAMGHLETDSNGNNIFLDTMVSNKDGNLYLTQNRLLREVKENGGQ